MSTSERLTSPSAAARRSGPKTTNHLDDYVGPFYDTSGLHSWAGSSRQAIHSMAQQDRLIACQLEDGSWVYPVWQFDDRATPKPALVRVWRELRGPAKHPHADPWTCALWMRTPHLDLGDMTPVGWIEGGRPAEVVLALARDDAARWESEFRREHRGYNSTHC